MLYFAYGSNMNLARMLKRVPRAKRVGIGLIDGWQLKERLYADIERKRNGEVWGVLYDVGYRGLSELDKFEGFPQVYTGKVVKVFNVKPMKWVDAWVYYMTPTARRAREFMPYPDDYRMICLEGAKANRLRESYIHFSKNK